MSILTRRVGNFQPFARSSDRDDGTSVGVQYGFITYDEHDNYRVSHFEMGFRSDHVYDIVGQEASQRSFDDAATYDVDILRRTPKHAAAEADVAANPAPTSTTD